jgi:hypothetical protein
MSRTFPARSNVRFSPFIAGSINSIIVAINHPLNCCVVW